MNDRGGATATRLVAVALGALFAGFAALYGWQAWHHGTPWLFSDELKLTLLSRAIAETGHAAWRGEPHSFETLYTYLTAPAWWTDDTKTAYTVVKAIGVAAMASVIFPSYALARMVASRPASLFAAAAAGAIPALAYSSLIIEEPLAYPYSALALFLTVKALVTRSRWWIGGAVAVALVGPWIRGQLSLLTAILGLATVLFVATGPWARKRLRTWSTWDRVGAGVLLCGALILLNELLAKHSDAWNVSTRIAKGRIFDLGLQAGSALTIGLGVLPVVVGLALMLSFGENASPARRAFACTFWAALCAFTTYTAIKAAYLSTVFATRVEERNLIYVAPLLFAATAIWLDRPRLRLVPAGAALLFVLFLIVRKPYQLDYPYFEAPGTGIVVLANREFNWSNDYERTILLWVLGFVALVGLLPTALSAARRSVSETWAAAARGMLVALAVVLIAWNLTGEIYTARGFNDLSSRFVRNLPKPLDWVDEATGGKPVVYLGQRIQDPNGVWLTEFWNRSIKKVWSTDGTAPGPAPVLTPDLGRTDGTLTPPPETDYALADNGVLLAGRPVVRRRGLRLYKIDGTLRLAEAVDGVYVDGWMADHASWSKFTTPGSRAGTVVVTLSRRAFCNRSAPEGHVVVRVGDLVIGKDRHAALGRVRAARRVVLRSCEARVVRMPSGKPPFQVLVTIDPTFRLSDYGVSDSRVVGGVVGFGFAPVPGR